LEFVSSFDILISDLPVSDEQAGKNEHRDDEVENFVKLLQDDGYRLKGSRKHAWHDSMVFNDEWIGYTVETISEFTEKGKFIYP
jgi:hypothetical protein